jgi:Mce-associated membrane protein
VRADWRASALTYARQTAINLTSLDYKTLGADIEQVLDGATGAFADDFEARADNLRDVLTTNQVVSQGQVLEAALVRADERNATAIVVVDATVRNTQNPDGGVTTYRMKLELERQGDRWLTSTLEFVA